MQVGLLPNVWRALQLAGRAPSECLAALQHGGRAPSECLAELNLFRNIAGSGMFGLPDVSKVRSSFIFKVSQSNPEDGHTKIFINICTCLALHSP
jgi:hypothetical protein